MRLLTLVALIGLALASPSRGYAANSPKAQEKAAKKACAAGDFRKGVGILAGLYVDTDDVTYVYNQGRCYEQNHQWTSAIDRFREYLRKSPDEAAADRAEVEKHLSDCEVFRAQEEARSAMSPAPTPPAPAAGSAPVLPPPPASGKPVAEQTISPKGDRGSGLRVTGVVLGSAGIASAVVGLVLNLRANSLADDFDRTQVQATRSSQSSYKTGSMICYGAGAGMIAAGVVLYLFGRSATVEGSTNVSFLPTLTPTEFSLGVRRAF